jgi:protein-tyrosine-phosphatase
VHKINDPGQKWRSGIFLAVGATKGKNLFEGVTLTAKYFFDAVGARYEGSLTFRQIEEAGAIALHPTALEEAKEKAASIVGPLIARKKILFLCTENSCRSQMASAFAQHLAGDRIEVESAGSSPAENVNELMIQVMQEKGIDMAFRRPKSTADVASAMTPELIVSMGCEKGCPVFPDAPYQDWNLPDPADKPIGFMREIREAIEVKVRSLIETV